MAGLHSSQHLESEIALRRNPPPARFSPHAIMLQSNRANKEGRNRSTGAIHFVTLNDGSLQLKAYHVEDT